MPPLPIMKTVMQFLTIGLPGLMGVTVLAEDHAFFESRVRPLLVNSCYECHSGEKNKGGLALANRQGWQKGGESGPAIVPGKPEQSRLIKAVRYHDEKLAMPPKKKGGKLPEQAVPDAFEFRQESDATLQSYGLQRGQTTGFAWQCLAARRLIERGVRFVELIDTGSSGNWDAHGGMMSHAPFAKNVDQPIAALLRDLKQRGMFEDTLVVWTTEFGRTPFNNTADAEGCEHHPGAFCSWLAGADVKPGIVHGATDEIGLCAAVDPVHVRDFHATILHLMGFDHEQLTYRHAGLDFRLTGVEESHDVKDELA